MTSTRGHYYKLFKPHASCKPRQDFFATRVINAGLRMERGMKYKLPYNIVAKLPKYQCSKEPLRPFFADNLYNFR